MMAVMSFAWESTTRISGNVKAGQHKVDTEYKRTLVHVINKVLK